MERSRIETRRNDVFRQRRCSLGRIAIGYDSSKKPANEGDVLKAPELGLGRPDAVWDRI